MACAVSVGEANGVVKRAKSIGRRKKCDATGKRKWFACLSAVLVAIALVVLVQMFSGVPSHITMTNFGAALARISNCGIGAVIARLQRAPTTVAKPAASALSEGAAAALAACQCTQSDRVDGYAAVARRHGRFLGRSVRFDAANASCQSSRCCDCFNVPAKLSVKPNELEETNHV